MKSAFVVYSGGKPFEFSSKFEAAGFGMRPVASHRIEISSLTFPLGSKVDSIIFTSRNAVEVFERTELALYEKARIYAVGEATRDALRRAGREVEAPVPGSAAALLETLPPDLKGQFIFWPRGEDADLAFFEALKRRGAEVYAPSVYRKQPLLFPDDLGVELRARRYSAFSCTSPAAAAWLYSNLDPSEKRIVNGLPAAALGEKSAAELARQGAARVVVAPRATFGSLADTLISLLSEA
jgi:uroporphyrinogen-III synthase